MRNPIMSAYLDGYYAALGSETTCPLSFFSPYWLTWQTGFWHGEQVLRAQHEAIILSFPQD